MTCHDRRETTLTCLRTVKEQLPGSGLIVDVFLVDDGSTDGTGQAVVEFWPEVRLLTGDGNLFWNLGMRKAFAEATLEDYDYYLWLNDDTLLFPHSLNLLVNTANLVGEPGIVVGSTRDPRTQRTTYGGVVRPNGFRPLHFALLDPLDRPRPCETMNGNCVLVPRRVVETLGNLDPCFTHTGGDLDYGLRARKAGFSVMIAPGYVGTCPRNPPEGSYHDRSLSPLARLNRMLQIKERPIREKRVFAQRHCGRLWPLYWLYPYLKVSVPSRTWLSTRFTGHSRKAGDKGQ